MKKKTNLSSILVVALISISISACITNEAISESSSKTNVNPSISSITETEMMNNLVNANEVLNKLNQDISSYEQLSTSYTEKIRELSKKKGDASKKDQKKIDEEQKRLKNEKRLVDDLLNIIKETKSNFKKL